MKELEIYSGVEKRRFSRVEYSAPLAYKICKQETLLKLFCGYTVNISQSGLLCNIQDNVGIEDILWLSFEKNILNVCKELEKSSLIYQNGIIGKVNRINNNNNGTWDIGVQFLTRTEKNYNRILDMMQELPNEEL
ncbi:MAG: PilZ domain-containing protein [Candidatus Omnitrophota bacterium]